MKYKSDDYKISAVKYYLKNKDNIRKICKIFNCVYTFGHLKWDFVHFKCPKV